MAEASSTEDVITLRIRFKSETLEKFTERYAADLTQNEIFIRTRDPLPVGTTLALDLSLHDGSPLIAGRGSVAWTRGPELTREPPRAWASASRRSPPAAGRCCRGSWRPRRAWRTTSRPFRRRSNATEPSAHHRAPARTAGGGGRPTERTAPPAAEPPARASRCRAGEPPRRAPCRRRRCRSRAARPPVRRAGRRRAAADRSPPVPAALARGASPGRAAPRRARCAAPSSDDDAEPTELASLPPTFFYEGGGRGSGEDAAAGSPGQRGSACSSSCDVNKKRRSSRTTTTGTISATTTSPTCARRRRSTAGWPRPRPRAAPTRTRCPTRSRPTSSVAQRLGHARRPSRSQRRAARAAHAVLDAELRRARIRPLRPAPAGPSRRTPSSTPSTARPIRPLRPTPAGPSGARPPSLPSFGAPIPAVTREIKAPVPPTVGRQPRPITTRSSCRRGRASG